IMASSAKRRAVGKEDHPDDSEDNSSDEGLEDGGDSGDDSGSEEDINEEVIVDFEAHTITHNDHNGIKKLLQQLFLKAHVNTSQLTDLLIEQNYIGSVIRQAEVPEDSDDEGDPADEVFGFISMLNLTERKGVQCVKEVKDLILGQCEKSCPHSVTDELEKVLDDTSKPVGLLLSERFINVPPQIALPLHKQLQEEMAEAQRTNKPSGRCHYCLMISKTYKEPSNTVPARGAAPKDQLMFVNAEEEFFYEQATIKFHYSVQEETDTVLSGRWSFEDVPMKPQRTVMVIPADRISAVMDKLKEYLTV
uniref:Protein BCCIP homolog n=2 Tax=Esox lucius TaxID=8010 RepID=A0A6Q2WZ24_ESOLU